MSTARQENSPERQRQAFADYCARHDLAPCGDYPDLAVSATKVRLLDRPGIQRLLADAPAATWTIVWSEEVSRAARRGEEVVDLDNRLQAHHKVLVGPQDDPRQVVDAHFRKLLLFIKGWQAEGEVRQLATRVSDTDRLLVSQGQYVGQKLPPGIRWVWTDREKKAGHYAVDDRTAPLALRAFQVFADLQAYEPTALQLNLEGYTTAAGKPLSAVAVKRILRHPAYRGRYVWAGQEYPIPAPEIIPPALVAQVDARLAQLALRPQRCLAAGALWVGLLKCAECGRWLNSQNRKVGSRRYRCTRAIREPKSCTEARSKSEAVIEAALLPQIVAELRGMADRLRAVDQPRRKRQRTEQKLARLEEMRERARRAYVLGASTEEKMLQDFAELDAARAALQAEVTEAPAVTTEALRAAARNLERHWQRWDTERRRNLLQSLIRWVVLDMEEPERSEIAWFHE